MWYLLWFVGILLMRSFSILVLVWPDLRLKS